MKDTIKFLIIIKSKKVTSKMMQTNNNCLHCSQQSSREQDQDQWKPTLCEDNKIPKYSEEEFINNAASKHVVFSRLSLIPDDVLREHVYKVLFSETFANIKSVLVLHCFYEKDLYYVSWLNSPNSPIGCGWSSCLKNKNNISDNESFHLDILFG